MAFDPDMLLSRAPIEARQTVTPFRVMLYAVALGAHELDFVYEEELKVLPTMAAVMAYPGFFWADPAFGVDHEKVLHGETGFTVHAPLPISGELISTTSLGPIFDKGADKGAVVCQTREIRTDDGTLVATVRGTHVLRGDGGFGGTREGQPQPHAIPDRVPDLVDAITTRPDQALIYRLASGDMNPLHIDPQAAKGGGFDRPILHGMATFGIAGRAVLRSLCGNQPERVRRMDARFSRPVFPGETIETSIWREGDGKAAYRCRVVERNQTVLDNGYVEFL